MANGNQEINSIQAPGNSINLKDKDTSNPHYLSTMEISKMDTNMAREFNCLIMEIGMMECIQMENQKVKALMLGATVQFIKDSSRMDCVSVMEFGNMEHRNMKELI